MHSFQMSLFVHSVDTLGPWTVCLCVTTMLLFPKQKQKPSQFQMQRGKAK